MVLSRAWIEGWDRKRCVITQLERPSRIFFVEETDYLKPGIKIAIGGKGGVGKTTVCAVWAHLLAKDGFDVLALDADPDANLASAFGIPAEQSVQPLIEMKELIYERTGVEKGSIGAYFKLNPKVSDLPEKFSLDLDGLKLLVLGGLRQAGAGCACPEGAFLKALLTHTILQRKEVVLVDLAAGLEFMGRASVQGIDAMIIVVEPGSRSIETAVNIAKMAAQMGIRYTAAIANKITEPAEVDAVKAQLNDVPLIGVINYSRAIQQADLERKPVITADTELVEELKRAKELLMEALCI